MLKIRVAFVDNENGKKELEKAKRVISNNFDIINESNIYKGRNNSKYSNVYIDIEMRRKIDNE